MVRQRQRRPHRAADAAAPIKRPNVIHPIHISQHEEWLQVIETEGDVQQCRPAAGRAAWVCGGRL